MKISIEDEAHDVRVVATTQVGRQNFHVTVLRSGVVVREFDVAESLYGVFDLCRQNMMIEMGLGDLLRG